VVARARTAAAAARRRRPRLRRGLPHDRSGAVGPACHRGGSFAAVLAKGRALAARRKRTNITWKKGDAREAAAWRCLGRRRAPVAGAASCRRSVRAIAEAARVLRARRARPDSRPAGARRGLGQREARRPLAGVQRRPSSGAAPRRRLRRLPSVSARAARAIPFTVLVGAATKTAAATLDPESSTIDRPRILVLDGAMGTMIQRHKLTEADFRGERFKRPPARPARATTTCSC
jgi:hypothetical protein